MGSTPVDSTNFGLKIFGKKIPENSHKQYLSLTHTKHYDESMWMKWCVDIPCCSLYANTTLFYRRDLSICGFWYPWEVGGIEGAGVLEQIPHGYQRMAVLFFFNICFNYLPEVENFKIKSKLLPWKIWPLSTLSHRLTTIQSKVTLNFIYYDPVILSCFWETFLPNSLPPWCSLCLGYSS